MALDMSRISVSAFLKNANKGASPRRCLFGPVNHEENVRFLREQLAVQERESKAKWNFDFRTESPVSGKYNWERIGDDENQVPVAYTMPQLSKTPATPRKSRVCQPLSFSSRINLNNVLKVSNSVQKDIKCECPTSTVSPAADRKPTTTVPETNIVRDETPGSLEFTNSKTVSTSVATSSTTAVLSTSSVSQTQIGKSLKRKTSQTDITEFFNIKKARNVVAASSAKRKLDL